MEAFPSKTFRTKRTEALLNEYKGNIYEYLVAAELARAGDCAADFMKNLGGGFYRMLEQQEAFIREYYPVLLHDLPVLAQGLAKTIREQLPPDYQRVRLIGKSAATGEGGFGEADALVACPDGSRVPVSVKLSRDQAHVNTKSAGVKSFISKYFGPFSACLRAQEELASSFDREYRTMAYALHEAAGVEYDEDFANWEQDGRSKLPGELSAELREIFLKALYRVNNELYGYLSGFFEEDPEKFLSALRPLIGFSRGDIIQAATFYRPKDGGYSLERHVAEGPKSLESLRVLELRNRPESSSFDIVFNDRVLQIRLKAMNKFTSKGFKVNCAVKGF